jgi:hypothetical protein
MLTPKKKISMLKLATTAFSVIGFTVAIMFFCMAAAVLLIGPHGDHSKENVLLTANFVQALIGGIAVNNIVTRYLK